MGVFDALLGEVIDSTFSTHASMAEAALLWQLKEYQLNWGTFKGEMKAIHTSHIQLAHSCRSGGILIQGKIPQNTYLFASVKSAGKISQNGLRLDSDKMIVLSENDNLDFTVSSAFEDFTVVMDKAYFDTAFQAYFNKPFIHDKTDPRIQLKKNSGSDFRSTVKKAVAALMVQQTKLQDDPAFHAKTEYTILEILFQNIQSSGQRLKILESDMHANRIRKYLEMHFQEKISVTMLPVLEKYAERTIRLGFQNLFGLSPKQYLQCYRLGRVHHVLLENKGTSASVGDIAYDHGFTHMGRFTDKYKSMFGNTPSSTLKKASL